MENLTGKVAVITGGASGIGLAMARCFGGAGMKVVLSDVEGPALEAALRELADAGIEAAGTTTDVADRGAVGALADFTVERFGAAHVVCNNAGVGPGGVTWELPPSVWRWVLEVDLWGVINGIQAFVPRLVEQGEGHIVNTASMAGLIPSPGMAPYVAAKHAIVGLSQSLRHDLRLAGSPVGVSVLCPSMTRTRMNDSGRNWPARLGDPPDTGLAPGHPLTRASYRERMEKASADPGDVARLVLDAVLKEKFWVISDPDFAAAYARHVASVFND